VPFCPLVWDLGARKGLSRIPNPYFLELGDNVLDKNFYNSLETGPNFVLQNSKNKIIFNVVKFVAT
jgi:hypothetical protein